MTLDEKLEAVSKGMKTVNDALEPILQATPTIPQEGEGNERAVIIRKHMRTHERGNIRTAPSSEGTPQSREGTSREGT